MFTRNIAALILTVGSALSATAQSAQPIQSGLSQLALSSTFLSTAQAAGITIAFNGWSSANAAASNQSFGEAFTLPVVGGLFDLDTSKGQIYHSGGLDFLKGTYPARTDLGLSSFILDTTDQSGGPTLTALVLINNKVGSRISLFDAGPPTGFQLPLVLTDGVLLNLKGSVLTLDPSAASFLNTEFGTTVFRGGMQVGSLSTVATSFSVRTLLPLM